MDATTTSDLKRYFQDNFEYLNEEDIEVLSALGEEVIFEAGEELLEFDKYENAFFFFTEGFVRGFKYIENWEEFNIFFSQSGQSIMSPEKFMFKERRRNTVTFQAITDCSAIVFNHNELLEASTKYPGIFEFYHDRLKQITNALYERIQLLLIENAEERYNHLLKTRPGIVKYAHKKHIAQFLGITPNSFSRLMRKIQTENSHN